MARRKSVSRNFEILVGLTIVGALVTFLTPTFLLTSELTSVFISLAILIIFLGVGLLIVINHQERKRLLLLSIDDVDKMTGVEFEQYVGKILESKGYGIKFTKTSGDLGVDIIATKNGEKTGIQAKRYVGTVNRKAISDVVGSMRHYGFSKCVVVTTNYFTRDAKTLAESTDCKLVDRGELEKWIVEFQSKKSFKWI